MLKIRLNEQGKEIHPHLANEWLIVYGYNSVLYSFIVWDEIIHEWIRIPTTCCEGRSTMLNEG